MAQPASPAAADGRTPGRLAPTGDGPGPGPSPAQDPCADGPAATAAPEDWAEVGPLPFVAGLPWRCRSEDGERLVVRLDSPCVLIAYDGIPGEIGLRAAIGRATAAGRALLVIAAGSGAGGDTKVLARRRRGRIDCVAIQVPVAGDTRDSWLGDIAVLTGATGPVALPDGRSGASLAVPLGQARQVEFGEDYCAIIGGAGNPDFVDRRIEQICERINSAACPQQRSLLRDRAVRLSGGVTVLAVGRDARRT